MQKNKLQLCDMLQLFQQRKTKNVRVGLNTSSISIASRQRADGDGAAQGASLCGQLERDAIVALDATVVLQTQRQLTERVGTLMLDCLLKMFDCLNGIKS
jgi:hypothetical protein